MKALEKDRRRRYETANDFAADVMRYLTDQPVEACPPSAWYRFAQVRPPQPGGADDGGAGRGGPGRWARPSAPGRPSGPIAAERRGRSGRDARPRPAASSARQAVDEMYTQVAEKWLAQQPKLTPLQREFLEKALAFYEQFAASGPTTQARLEAARARTGSARSGRRSGSSTRPRPCSGRPSMSSRTSRPAHPRTPTAARNSAGHSPNSRLDQTGCSIASTRPSRS